MPVLAPNLAEPIAGYQIRERIGAGGYGEVWKAEAPGGLTKAIKFVYGSMDDQRAACELEALNRIKEVRHPFLLSLERIEVVEGQLLIVTELADSSLKERFEQCRRDGLPGIPRDELLACLSDAAEALDYMSEHSGLQHLDVKPENLLIVAGRVKVADFGLVRDQDQTMTLLGGLTPGYAAPEVFRGHPSRYSDQYSLAIVFQEMLTGALPFPGRTAAQLGEQHTRSRPRLSPLAPADREIVGRALAKDPPQRFPSCRALVSALSGVSPARGEPASQAAANDGPLPPDTASARGQATEVQSVPLRMPQSPPDAPPAPEEGHLEEPSGSPSDGGGVDLRPDSDAAAVLRDDSGADGPNPAGGAGIPACLEDTPAPQVLELTPIAVVADEFRLRPTLYLGIGGTASRVLWRLRRRLLGRFQDPSPLPIFDTLLVDTDPRTFSQEAGDPEVALAGRQMLPCLLRQSQQYRDHAGKLLQWLSRRWLYNIPKSLTTEGLRPLGRLALVDHGATVLARVREALGAIVSPQAVSASEAQTGLGVAADRARVVLVASISGGSGSGMVLDLAYAARQILGELGLADDQVYGILIHATRRQLDNHRLATANAYACLAELQHYSRVAPYPGDDDFGLAPRHCPDDTFRAAYLAHLGSGLDEPQYDRATDAVAKYLFLDGATAAGLFFDRCRESADDPQLQQCPQLPLRTFAVQRVPSADEIPGNGFPPLLAATGGARRSLLLLPEEPVSDEVQRAIGQRFPSPTVLSGNGDPLLCCEAEQLPLDRVARTLLEGQEEFAELAHRLHTRIDVAWSR